MGPGSFTGLRIGLASAEAMAYSWHKPICGVNTLKALAYNLPIDGYVLSPVLDAQKGNFYQAVYEWQHGKLIEHQKIKVVDCKQLLENIAVLGIPALLLGECQKIDHADLPSWCRKAPAHLCLPQAASVALLRKPSMILMIPVIFLVWNLITLEDQRLKNYGKNASRNNDKVFDSGRFDCCQQHR